MPRTLFCTLLMSALALAGARAQPTVLNLPRENRDAVLQKILEPIREKQALPALASAVVTSDGLQAIAAVGVRKVGTHIAVTPDDQWHLGSDTKIMTATMLAQLVLAGKLKWTSSIEE